MASARRNFLFQAALTGANIVYPLATFAWVARIMGTELLGRISFATSIAAWFTLLASAAIPLYGSREIAKAREDRSRLDRTFSGLIAVNLLTTGAAVLTYSACVVFSGTLRGDWPLFAAAGCLLLANAANLEWMFQGLEDFRATLVRNLTVKGLSFLLILLLVDGKEDAVLFISLGSAAIAVYNLWGLWHARGKVRFSLRDARPSDHLRPLALLAGATAASSAYVYLDGVLLGILAGDHALGLFSTAIRISRTLLTAVMALTLALLPRLSYLRESGRSEESAVLTQKSIHAIWFFCFPAFAILWALAPQLVALLAGPDFLEGVPTLRITLLLLPVAGLGNFLGLQVLFPTGNEKALLYAGLAGVAASLAGNLLLIPAWKQDGSAMAAVAAEAAALAVLMIWSRRMRFSFRLADARALRYLVLGIAAGTAAAAAARLFPGDFPALAAGLAAGAAAYLVPLAALGDPVASDALSAAASRLRALAPGGRK